MHRAEEHKSHAESQFKNITVPGYRELEPGVVYYYMNITGANGSAWSIKKRYSQFETFHAVITELYHNKVPIGAEIPGKKIKWLQSHSSPQFLEERRVLLEAYLKKLLSVLEIAKSSTLNEFLTTDKLDKSEQEIPDRKVPELPEDAEITSISIPATRTMSDHVLYQIDVVNCRKRKTFSKWTVLKRFGQFYEMDQAMRTMFANNVDILAELPQAPERKSKLVYDHMDEGFVEQRRILLENYLNNLLHYEPARKNKEFLTFLGVS